MSPDFPDLMEQRMVPHIDTGDGLRPYFELGQALFTPIEQARHGHSVCVALMLKDS